MKLFPNVNKKKNLLFQLYKKQQKHALSLLSNNNNSSNDNNNDKNKENKENKENVENKEIDEIKRELEEIANISHMIELDYPTSHGFVIDYEIKPSPGKGNGVFTKQFIPKDSLVWVCNFDNHELFKNEEQVRKRIALFNKENSYTFLDWIYATEEGGPQFEFDEGHFVNHSHKAPNIGIDRTKDPTNLDCFAYEDIPAGSEILTDYGGQWGEFPEWFSKILDEYGVSHDYASWTL